MTLPGARALVAARGLPREALQSLIDAWEARARVLILEAAPDAALHQDDLERVSAAFAAQGNDRVARALRWFAHMVAARKEHSLARDEAVENPDIAYDYFSSRARIVRTIAAELTGGPKSLGGETEYQRQIVDVELARRHWRL